MRKCPREQRRVQWNSRPTGRFVGRVGNAGLPGLQKTTPRPKGETGSSGWPGAPCAAGQAAASRTSGDNDAHRGRAASSYSQACRRCGPNAGGGSKARA